MRKLPLLAGLVFGASLVLGCGSEIAAPRVLLDSGTANGDACAITYPAGPYGTDVGGVLEPHTFTGRKNGIPAGGGVYDQIALADYYAMRLSGKKYLVLNVAAFWCSPCREEAKDLEANFLPKYGPKGVEFLSIVLEKSDATPTAPSDIDVWIKTFGLTFAVANDPDYYVAKFFNPKSMPLNMIIDLSNMTIVSKTIGANLPQVGAKLDMLLGGT